MASSQSLSKLGLALVTGDEAAFRNVVEQLLQEDDSIVDAINNFVDNASELRDAKFPRQAQENLRALENCEYKLVRWKFANVRGPNGGIIEDEDDPMKDSTETRLYNSFTSWLTSRLLDGESIDCDSVLGTMICTTLLRWGFWMILLDGGETANAFCQLLSDNVVEREKVAAKLQLLLAKTEPILIEAHRALKLHLQGGNHASNAKTQKRRAQRARQKANRQQVKEKADEPNAIEIIRSTAPLNHVGVSGSILVLTPKIVVRMSDTDLTAVLDTGTTVSTIERNLFLQHCPSAQIRTSKHPVNPYGGQGFTMAEAYADVDVFIPALAHGRVVMAQIPQRFRVVEHAHGTIVLGFDFIMHNGIAINTSNRTVSIAACQNAEALLRY